METYGIGRGEAACLVLAQRHGAPALFVSADQEACEVADEIGIPRHYDPRPAGEMGERLLSLGGRLRRDD